MKRSDRRAFAARSLARAEAMDEKKARSVTCSRRWPGKRFEMDALPPYHQLERCEHGWTVRVLSPTTSRGAST